MVDDHGAGVQISLKASMEKLIDELSMSFPGYEWRKARESLSEVLSSDTNIQ